MRDDRDEVIERIVDELKTLPAVPADATARVLARVDAARRGETPGAYSLDDDDVIFFPPGTDEMQASPVPAGRPLPAAASGNARGMRRRFMVSLPAAIGYALAATVAGFLVRGAMPTRTPSQIAVEPPSASGPQTVQPVAALSSRAAQELPVQVQFVLDAPNAGSVALVGDFNAWDSGSAQLVRDSASGVWSTVIAVKPGRHVYAYLVDGKTWTLDPRAPRVKDADYGTEQSVMIVGLR